MPRKPRIHLPGGFYHVILRGNCRQNIFFGNADRNRFFLLIEEGYERFHFKLHGFCLMNNHVHLLIQVGEIPLSRIIQNLSFRYTRYINRKMNRFGHLFQGRYTAILIDAETYMLELVRYIHNNPIRANIVKNPLDYKWSSYPAYMGNQDIPFLTTSWVLGHFAQTESTARKKFAEFVQRESGEEHRKDLNSGGHDSRILGDKGFMERVLPQKSIKKKPHLDAIVKQVCTNEGVKEEELSGLSRQRKLAELRGIIGWLARDLHAASLSDVAKRFNRDLATISRAVRKVDERQLHSIEMRALLEKWGQACMIA